LTYPEFTKPFETYTDASMLQWTCNLTGQSNINLLFTQVLVFSNKN